MTFFTLGEKSASLCMEFGYKMIRIIIREEGSISSEKAIFK